MEYSISQKDPCHKNEEPVFMSIRMFIQCFLASCIGLQILMDKDQTMSQMSEAIGWLFIVAVWVWNNLRRQLASQCQNAEGHASFSLCNQF